MFQRARIQARLLHLLRSIVIRLHTHLTEYERIGGIYIRMCNIDTTIKDIRPAEDYIVCTHLVSFLYIADAVEPNQIHQHIAIRKVGNQMFFPARTCFLETQNLTFHLHKRHIRRQLIYHVEPATVYMLIGEIIEQVVPRVDIQLLTQHLGSVRPYARQIG